MHKDGLTINCIEIHVFDVPAEGCFPHSKIEVGQVHSRNLAQQSSNNHFSHRYGSIPFPTWDGQEGSQACRCWQLFVRCRWWTPGRVYVYIYNRTKNLVSAKKKMVKILPKNGVFLGGNAVFGKKFWYLSVKGVGYPAFPLTFWQAVVRSA